MQTKMVVIFPKADSYKFKSEETNSIFRKQVRDRLEDYLNIDILSIYCFREDILACMLLPTMVKRNINVVSCFGRIDQVLWEKSNEVSIVPPMREVKDGFIESIVKESTKKITGVTNTAEGVKRTLGPQQLLNARRRYVVSEVIASPEFLVLYLDKGNQYCNLADTALGDLRMVHKAYLNSDTDHYAFSGQYVDKELYFTVLKEGLQYGAVSSIDQ